MAYNKICRARLHVALNPHMPATTVGFSQMAVVLYHRFELRNPGHIVLFVVYTSRHCRRSRSSSLNGLEQVKPALVHRVGRRSRRGSHHRQRSQGDRLHCLDGHVFVSGVCSRASRSDE